MLNRDKKLLLYNTEDGKNKIHQMLIKFIDIYPQVQLITSNMQLLDFEFPQNRVFYMQVN